MKKTKYVAGSIVALLVIAAIATAQPPQDNSKETTPLQVTIIFNEFDGGKRVSSLPYQMACNATPRHEPSSLRLGLRVPIATGAAGDKYNTQYSYQDVGTDIDCRAMAAPEGGGFLIGLGLKRNVVYPPNQSPKPTEWQPGAPLNDRPIFGGFEANVRDLLLHDGETVQAATATDPVSGHVWKIDVSLKVGK
ncbi:MAG TPA: hypothetical protein VGZ29_10945 [Terriglobia bacterium]|nr:hypothetical protein [Terriglobia bacterium]